MSSGSIKQKHIEVELDVGSFGETFSDGSEKKVIAGLATTVSVSKCGLPTLNQCTVDILNMKQEDIEKITTTSHKNLNMRKSKITVKAGILNESLDIVYKGEVFLAYGIYPGSDLGVHIEARTGIYYSVEPDEPYTKQGQVSALSIVKEQAGKLDATFKDNGAKDMQLTDPVFNGSPIAKAQAVMKHIDQQLVYDDDNLIVSPWYKGLPDDIVECNKDSGMIGYPYFHNMGIQFRHEFNGRFRQCGQVNMKSIVPKASGKWKIMKLEHLLQAHGAGPAWDTTIWGVYPDGA